MEKLNPYQIKWSLVVLTQNPPKHKLRFLNTLIESGTASEKRCFFFFHGAGDKFKKRQSRVISAIASLEMSATVYTFTDKQYGMISNSFNGKEPVANSHFSHPITLQDGDTISIVPLSKDQIENAIQI